ncbi:MAG: DUF255 domain-containing protein [Phycisphaerae bacterium]|nr:DUF255 domain-containing protein [Phycisphaerae bacterium]
MSNRLANETSPYLLQHQHNPVDWYPWGEEAFQAAQEQNKPIFLSVGYSTCYWCHVMERQCFEVQSIAALMNRWFINIKVDREERPDVDQLFMMAVQLLTRQGGWPMSVFLLPDRRPFYGGTYFPPTDGHGRPGFPRLLEALRDAFDNRRHEVVQTADQLTNAIKQISNPQSSDASFVIDRAWLDRMIDRSTSDYDPQLGGFGAAPKFPRETLLELLLVTHRRSRDSKLAHMLRHTLSAMADGGIRDQLGGGFHRYSTDARWLVPHFEIMLYDNAMLAWIYAEASRQFDDERFARVARGICDFVLREMTDPAGSFYTAFDAEVDGREGQNYLWTETEINELLGDDAPVFSHVYGIDEGPNFADPHHGNGIAETNILFLPHGPADETEPRIESARQKLLAARAKRKQPLLDTKILTSWNALMIRGLAHAGEILGEPRYAVAANKAADWLLRHHRAADGKLFRTSRDSGAAKFPGFLDDYAFLAQALLSLNRIGDARAVTDAMRQRFQDETAGGFFFTDRSADELFARQMVITDSPLPSGNGIAAQVLLTLGDHDATARLLAAFAGSLRQDIGGTSALLEAADAYVEAAGPLTIAGGKSNQRGNQIVSITARWNDARTASIRVTIADEYHLNAREVPAGLSKIELIATPPAEIEYPIGEPMADGLNVYRGQVELIARWSQPPAGAIRFRLNYQPCTDTACLAAQSEIIELPASLKDAGKMRAL